MTPEEAFKHIEMLVKDVEEAMPQRALWLIIQAVQELTRKARETTAKRAG